MLKNLSRGTKIFLSILATLIITFGLSIIFDTSVVKLQNVKIYSPKIDADKSVRILQITDFHLNYKIQDQILDLARKNPADIIVLTGDFLNSTTKNINRINYLLEETKKINPNVYFVLGNHDLDNDNIYDFIGYMNKVGITVLLGETKYLDIKGSKVSLSGVLYVKNDVIKNLNVINPELTSKNEYYKILLSHRPLDNNYKNIDINQFNLIIAGHTHGGQLAIPWLNKFINPKMPEPLKMLYKGLYNIGKEQYLYVCSGVGTSVIPLRIFNQAQVSYIEIY